jgi:ABC-type multidrug transport system fused ATPase/permease subunit
VKDLEAQTLSMIQESMSMLRVVVAFGREGYEWRRFHEQGEHALDARVNVTVRQTVFGLIVNLITAAGMTFVIGLGSAHILQGKLTVGELLVVIAYISSVYQSLGTISSTIGSLQDQVVSLQRAFELLDTQPDVIDKHNAVELSTVEGEIEFENVSFTYSSDADALCDISVKIRSGDYVAIVGPTGAGKTTLVNLIPRFYDPAGGQVRIDGRNVQDFTLQSLREQISIVGQEPILFCGSILDNIRYGRLDASEPEIINAARSANAHEFIMRLPDQYETEVGERGAGLSGGERQRIAVARAFLKDAPILILDEPTAFIDVKTESEVLHALATLRQGRTTLMISHRIATIRDADKILVLEEGRIVESGTHSELSADDGLYQQFNVIQTEQGDDSH